jgi:hypothetical protein
MTVLEDVKNLLVQHSPRALCDDCIADKIEITPRQHANHKTRELAHSHKFDRRKNVCSSCGKVKLVIRYVQKTQR